MDPRLFGLFLRELQRQCQYAQFSIEAYNEAMGDGTTTPNSDRVFWALQSFFAAAGNISKILWPNPNKPQYQPRGEYLRVALGISNTSSLKVRAMRNKIEHFDEELEDWWNTSRLRNFIDSNIGPIRGIAGIDAKDYLRNLEQPLKYTFQGKEYDVIPLLEEIMRLRTDINALVAWLGVK